MARDQSAHLPLIPLPPSTVLLPGAIHRLVVSSQRPDIAALLANVYERASFKNVKQPGRIDNVPIACVPLASPLLGPDGELLLQEKREVDTKAPEKQVPPARAKKADLFAWGTVARITGVEGRGTGEFTLVLVGVARARIEKLFYEMKYLEGKLNYFQDEIILPDPVVEDLFEQLKTLSRQYVAVLGLLRSLPRTAAGLEGLPTPLARRLDQLIAMKEPTEAGTLADYMAHLVKCSYEERLQVLALLDVKERMLKVMGLLERQIGGIKNQVAMKPATSMFITLKQTDVNDYGPDIQRLLELMRTSQVPLRGPRHLPMLPGFSNRKMGGGEKDEEQGQEPNEVQELQKRLEAARLSPLAAKVAGRELKRLKRLMPQQAEYAVAIGYLETLAEIPWSAITDDGLDTQTLTRARKQLDDDHYGLEKVKKRLLEYLAVLRLKQSVNQEVEAQIRQAEQQMQGCSADKALVNPNSEERTRANDTQLNLLKRKRMTDKSPILLLIGPPGVGKTSLARSVATALGRKFHRISLGGVRDEAEIRGHRRTYVAAMPGVIVQGLRKVGVANPVFLLDEIDKVSGSNFHGDPSAAMLEVLDPEQNHAFVDHYVNVPVDLGKVLFIATANNTDTIPPPLLDRMETIYIPGYTTLEKRHIAMQHLVPKQIRINGLQEDQVHFTPEVVDKVIESYTREAGVRSLERELGSVCRAKAVEFADAKDAKQLDKYKPDVHVDDIEAILGIERFEEEIAEKTSRPGIVTGLVAYSSGGHGSILFIEVAVMPGTGSVQLTGKLGDVLKESVEVALTWVKAHAYELGLTAGANEMNIMKDRSIHVHCPSGSIPKDGPSSGIAQAIALISLFANKPVPPTMAMTGEISLRGRVTAVGGIKEKLIGALRAGVKTVLLPDQNRKDVRDLPQEVRDGLHIIHIGHIWEAIRQVWPDAHWPGEPEHASRIESRL